jgi:outer membrane protein assembly factor BamE
MTLKSFSLTLLLVASLTACGQPFWLPAAHKIDIQQGNLLTDKQIDQLQTGMSRQNVIAVLGDPVLQNAIQKNRWDYVYTRGLAGEHVKATTLVIYFKDDTVSSIENNYRYKPDDKD